MAKARKARPLGIYFLAILIAWIAGWNGLRLGEAILFWNTLKAYAAAPMYISLSGGVWLMFGIFVIWSLWQGKVWGWVLVMVAVAGYTFWYWFDRLALQMPHANWLFVLVSQIVFLLIIYLVLFSKKVKGYFKREADERKPETPKLA